MTKVYSQTHFTSFCKSVDSKSDADTQCEEIGQDYGTVSCNSRGKVCSQNPEEKVEQIIGYLVGSVNSQRSKFKSSLCRNFAQTGNCHYGSKCQFAHGPAELRCNLECNTSYKTKHCNAFLKKGVCSFGFRCNFIHKIPEPETYAEQQQKIKQNANKMKQMLSNCREVIVESKIANNGSRLMSILGHN